MKVIFVVVVKSVEDSYSKCTDYKTVKSINYERFRLFNIRHNI